MPDTAHQSLCVVALILCKRPDRYRKTQLAYDRYVRTYGPDDFFRITKHVQKTLDQMSVADILAYLRLSNYDSHQFVRYLPRLRQLVPSFTDRDRTALLATLDRVWQRYFPIGEEHDLAADLANLCRELQDRDRVLKYAELAFDQ